MASVVARPNGHHWIQFRFNKKRYTLRLGKVPRVMASEYRRHVEEILASKETGEPLHRATFSWVNGLTHVMREKFVRVGLLEKRDGPDNLGGMVAYCMEQYEANKVTTRDSMRYSANKLVEFFGRERLLHSINAGDAEDFRRWLRRLGRAESTVSSICTRSKRLFNMAYKKQWITENPFAEMSDWAQAGTAPKVFIEASVANEIISVCDTEWACIVALMRWGGLRAPSEVLDLKWEYINWEHSRMVVFSSKNARNAGKWRTCPIFAELHPHLNAQWERAESGEEYVIRGHRNIEGDRPNRALYSAFRKRVIRAGHAPWPDLLRMLRSTRETELCETYPLHVVTEWLGNSPDIARKHYLSVQSQWFDLATGSKGALFGEKNTDPKQTGPRRSKKRSNIRETGNELGARNRQKTP